MGLAPISHCLNRSVFCNKAQHIIIYCICEHNLDDRLGLCILNRPESGIHIKDASSFINFIACFLWNLECRCWKYGSIINISEVKKKNKLSIWLHLLLLWCYLDCPCWYTNVRMKWILLSVEAGCIILSLVWQMMGLNFHCELQCCKRKLLRFMKGNLDRRFHLVFSQITCISVEIFNKK